MSLFGGGFGSTNEKYEECFKNGYKGIVGIPLSMYEVFLKENSYQVKRLNIGKLEFLLHYVQDNSTRKQVYLAMRERIGCGYRGQSVIIREIAGICEFIGMAIKYAMITFVMYLDRFRKKK